MMRPLFVAVLALCTVLALPSTSAASHDPSGAPFDEDFVTGRVVQPETCTASLCFHIVIVFDVHSGPSGENATGTVRIDIESPPGNVIDTFGTASVTCLIVSGNRGTMGAGAPVFGLVSVEDNDGAEQDRSGVSLPFEPLVCPTSPSTAVSPIFGGDIIVHDAPAPPTSKEQCANGGWRGFPGFRNQGDCVSFVATGGKNPPAGT
jgi:hypothetical protein